MHSFYSSELTESLYMYSNVFEKHRSCILARRKTNWLYIEDQRKMEMGCSHGAGKWNDEIKCRQFNFTPHLRP